MEVLEKYRQIVKELLTDHASTNEPEIECQIICDTESDRYLLVDIGWQNLHRTPYKRPYTDYGVA